MSFERTTKKISFFKCQNGAFLRTFMLLFQLNIITYSTQIHPDSRYLLIALQVNLLHQKISVKLYPHAAVTCPVCCSANAYTQVFNSN